MNEAAAITCLFLDIGGVLLTVILTTHLCCSRQNSRVGSDGHCFTRTFRIEILILVQHLRESEEALLFTSEHCVIAVNHLCGWRQEAQIGRM